MSKNIRISHHAIKEEAVGPAIAYYDPIINFNSKNKNANIDLNSELISQSRNNIIIATTSLFTIGYLMTVIVSVNTILLSTYSNTNSGMEFKNIFMTTSFQGAALGHLVFGYLTDLIGRDKALKLSSTLLIVFSLASTLSLIEIFTIDTSLILLSVSRFFLGIAIGGIYPTASVSNFENSSLIKKNDNANGYDDDVYDNRSGDAQCVLVNSLSMDLGTFASSLIPLLLLQFTTIRDARILSMLCLFFGCVPSLVVFSCFFFKSSKNHLLTHKSNLIHISSLSHNHVDLPITTDNDMDSSDILEKTDIIDRKYSNYVKNFIYITFTWTIYDLLIYPIVYYSAIILSGESISNFNSISLKKTLLLSLLLNGSCVPAPIISSKLLHKIKILSLLSLSMSLQFFLSTVLFFISTIEDATKTYVIPILFCLLMFSSELGMGSCISIYASKSYPPHIRGRLCAASSLCAKTGAFVGTLLFPHINKIFSQDENSFLKFFFFLILLFSLILFFSVAKLKEIDDKSSYHEINTNIVPAHIE